MSVSLRLEPREKGLKLETRNVHLLPEDGFRREQFRNLVDELAAGANVWFEPKNGWRTGIDSLLNNDHQCSLRGFRIEISSLRDSRIRTKFDRDWSQIHDTHGYSLGALNCHPELLAIDNSNRPTLARTIDGLLYCRFGEYFEMSSEAIPVIAKSSALIIDLRIARNAMLKPLNKDFRNDLEKAVGLLTTKTTPYCTLKRSDWRRWFDPHYHWKVRPNKEGPGAIPVVVLIDDRTGPRYGLLALMLSSLENVRLVGQPTKGVEGPYRYHLLPDGLSVAMPSQPVMTMGGRNASLNGIVPDVVVEHGNHKEGDPVFERGLVELREMIQNTLKQSEE